MGDNNFSNILYTAAIAIFGALAKEINDKSTTNETLSVFFSEIILHGFSGWIVGLAANKYFGFTDLTSITIWAGIGGLFGYDMVKVLYKILVTSIANSRNVKLNESDTNPDDKNKK